MPDDSADRQPSRRRVLRTGIAAGTLSGLTGCLGVLDETDSESPAGTPEATKSPEDGRETEEGGGGETSEENGETEGGCSPEDADGESPDLVETGPAVGLETVATGVMVPTDVEVLDGGGRLLVTDKFGQVYDIDPTGDDPPALDGEDLFLDMTDTVHVGSEAGLLGLTVHPEFPDDDRIYVRYSVPPDEDDPTPYEYDDHVERLSEFRATDDRSRADPDSERVLLTVPQAAAYHNSGDVLFGPDGYLYVSTGDGNFWTGKPQEEWPLPSSVNTGSSQNTKDNLRGGILRIDIDGEDPYGVPPDNPLADEDDHLGEFYAWGFRNPWGVSFDGDDCYVADVGAQLYEWINRVEKGGNYGWPIKEGTHCYNSPESSEPLDDDHCPAATPDHVRGGERFRDPVVEVPRSHDGLEEMDFPAIIGGGVYRGEAIPELRGEYVFGSMGGHLFVSSPGRDRESAHPYYCDRDLWPVRELDGRYVDDHAVDADDEGVGSSDRTRITAIGTAPDGGVYVLTSLLGEVREGNVLRLVSPDV